jgi:cytochrome c oxidase assembly protein subunit 15
MADVTAADTRTPGQPASGLLERIPLPSERTLRRLAIASLVSQIGIIVTGGAVRLTGSGLGCPEWPRCTPTSVTATPEMGIRGAIEFGNRLLTIVIGVIAALMITAVWRTLRSNRPRRDLLVPSVVLLLGIPAQAVIGGMTVWTDLNPWVVMLHFNLSAVLVGAATVLVRRAQRPLGVLPGRLDSPWLSRLGLANLAAASLVVYLGTIVTGSGPLAGDPDSPRTGFDVASVAQIHAHAVTLLIGLSIGLYAAARAVGSPGRLAAAAGALLVVELAQGLVGAVQYLLELPEVLVGLHMLGAALLVAAAVDAWLASRWLPVEHPVLGAQPA